MGEGVQTLDARVDMGAEVSAKFALDKVLQGAGVVGGCCEISPASIKVRADHLTGNGDQIICAL